MESAGIGLEPGPAAAPPDARGCRFSSARAGGAAPPIDPARITVRDMKRHIPELEARLCKLRASVDALWAQRRALQLRSSAAQAAVEQCMALLRLGALLQERRPPPPPPSDAQRPRGGLQPVCVASAAPDWRDHMARMAAELGEGVGARAAAAGAARARARPGERAASPPDAAADPAPAAGGRTEGSDSRLGWSPECAAAWFGGAGAELSTDGLRRAIRRFVHKAAPLCM